MLKVKLWTCIETRESRSIDLSWYEMLCHKGMRNCPNESCNPFNGMEHWLNCQRRHSIHFIALAWDTCKGYTRCPAPHGPSQDASCLMHPCDLITRVVRHTMTAAPFPLKQFPKRDRAHLPCALGLLRTFDRSQNKSIAAKSLAYQVAVGGRDASDEWHPQLAGGRITPT